ncbi:MAG: cellulase family glycosylhydrolase [Segetibacter sp.]
MGSKPWSVCVKGFYTIPQARKICKGVVVKFSNDNRILGWDIWNEPDNMTGPSYEKVELPNKVQYVIPLLRKAFAWARSANPEQPLTSGIWVGDWSSDAVMKPIEKLQIEESDIITFHNYDKPDEFEKEFNGCNDTKDP